MGRERLREARRKIDFLHNQMGYPGLTTQVQRYAKQVLQWEENTNSFLQKKE